MSAIYGQLQTPEDGNGDRQQIFLVTDINATYDSQTGKSLKDILATTGGKIQTEEPTEAGLFFRQLSSDLVEF